MPKPGKRKPPGRKPKSAEDDGAVSGRTTATNATSQPDSGPTQNKYNVSSTIEVDLRILKVLYAVQFTGFLRGHTSEEWTGRWTNGDLADLRKRDNTSVLPIPPIEHDGHAFDDVPDYILSAIASTRGVSEHEFKNTIRLLEAREDIQHTRDVNWYGRWCTEDGHIIKVRWGDQPFPPTSPPYNAIVTLDGESFQQRWQFDHPVGKCYALTTEGIKRVETALEKKPDTGATVSPTRHSPDQSPRVGGGRVAEPTNDPSPVASPKPSHKKARAIYEWAMEHIEGAEDMTYAELFEKLTNDPRCAGEGLPDNTEAFARYCRAAGIRRNTPLRKKGATRSVRRISDI